MVFFFKLLFFLLLLYIGIEIFKNETRIQIPENIEISEELYENLSLQCDVTVYRVSKWPSNIGLPYKKTNVYGNAATQVYRDAIEKSYLIRNVIQNAQVAKDCLPELRDRTAYVNTLTNSKNKFFYNNEENALLVYNTKTNVLYVSRGSR